MNSGEQVAPFMLPRLKSARGFPGSAWVGAPTADMQWQLLQGPHADTDLGAGNQLLMS